jgi:hypothetical protein
MSRFRRVIVAVGAPLVVVIGLAGIWGVRNAAALKSQVEAWADSLENSPNPVTMHLSFLPVYVDGDRVGKLDAVVIQRHRPATVDSIRIQIATSDDFDSSLFADCAVHFDPDAIERSGPAGYKHALSCVNDTAELVRFGTVALSGLGHDLALYLDSGDLPCEHMVEGDQVACTEIGAEIHRLQEEIQKEIRVNIKRDIRTRF